MSTHAVRIGPEAKVLSDLRHRTVRKMGSIDSRRFKHCNVFNAVPAQIPSELLDELWIVDVASIGSVIAEHKRHSDRRGRRRTHT